MNYPEAIGYLNSFINYEKIGYKERRVFNLDRMRRLAARFGDPHLKLRCAQVSGTKGKGSTSGFLASILAEAGYKTGLYTSPHLNFFEERFRINGNVITGKDLTDEAARVRKVLEKAPLSFNPTFFEISTLLAFNYFVRSGVDFAVIETGMGGRLDATNIAESDISIITPISFDHTEILGAELSGIAREKCGIIKKGKPCVSAPQKKEVMDIIKNTCVSQECALSIVGEDITFTEKIHDEKSEIFDVKTPLAEYRTCRINLAGKHQIINACSAIAAAEILSEKGLKISEDHLRSGIEKSENPGRFEIVSRKPIIVIDGAQNRESAAALRKTFERNFKGKKPIVVIGVSKGKDIIGIVEELASMAKKIIFTKCSMERAEDPLKLKKAAPVKDAITCGTVKDAMDKARKLSGPEGAIVVTGSFFVIKELERESDEK